jgi:hypothetical protein
MGGKQVSTWGLVDNLEERDYLGKPVHRYEDYIKLYFKGIQWQYVE